MWIHDILLKTVTINPRHICIPNQLAVRNISISSILPQGTQFTIQLKIITLVLLSEQDLEEEKEMTWKDQNNYLISFFLYRTAKLVASFGSCANFSPASENTGKENTIVDSLELTFAECRFPKGAKHGLFPPSPLS